MIKESSPAPLACCFWFALFPRRREGGRVHALDVQVPGGGGANGSAPSQSICHGLDDRLPWPADHCLRGLREQAQETASSAKRNAWFPFGGLVHSPVLLQADKSPSKGKKQLWEPWLFREPLCLEYLLPLLGQWGWDEQGEALISPQKRRLLQTGQAGTDLLFSAGLLNKVRGKVGRQVPSPSRAGHISPHRDHHRPLGLLLLVPTRHTSVAGCAGHHQSCCSAAI